MKKTLLSLLGFILLLTEQGLAQNLATYTGVSGNSTTVVASAGNETVTNLATTGGFGGNTPCSSGGISGLTVPLAFNAYSPTGPHIYFKVIPNAGYTLNVTGLTVGMRESGTGPTRARFAYSLDNGTTWVSDGLDHPLSPGGSCGSNTNYTWNGTLNVTGITNTNGVMIGVFPYLPGSASGTFSMNNVVVNGIVVSACTAPTLTTTVTNEPCNGGATGGVALTTTGGSSPFTYAWTGPMGFTATTQNITNRPAGTYSVTVTANGSCTVATTATITEPAIIDITATNNISACNGTDLQLGASSGTPGVTYSWTGPNSFTSTLQNPVIADIQTAAQGIYTVTAGNGTCTSGQATTNVTVNPIPTSGITSLSADTFCAGGNVTMQASTDIGTSYAWLNNGSATGNITDNYTANTSGSYQVVATSAAGCSDTSVNTIVLVNDLPTAALVQNGTIGICNGTSTTFNASTGTGYTYDWQLNNTDINGATDANYDANAAGTYDVQITDANGCVAISGSVTITVDTAIATITPGGPTTFCDGGNVMMNANTGNNFTYQWDQNGTDINGATDNNFTATTAGTYNVTVTNTGGCIATSDPLVITVNTLPDAVVTPQGPTSVCAGSMVQLLANNGAGYTYQWYEGNDPVSGATNMDYTTNAADFYSVLVTDANNCSQISDIVPVTVFALPAANVTPAGPTVVCSNNEVVLNATAGLNYSYQWYDANGNIAGATNAGYNAAATGTYGVVITDGNNCTDTSATIAVTVNPMPLISAGGATTFCFGSSVIVGLNLGGVNANQLNFQWQQNGAAIPGASDDSYTAQLAGIYHCIVSIPGNCADTTTDITVVVNPLPNPVITRAGNVLSTTTNFLTYQWYKNGVAVPGATNLHYTLVQNTNYTVVVSDSNGCTNTSQVFNVTDLSVSIVNNADVEIYPNPANEKVYVRYTGIADAIIYSMDGREMLNVKNVHEMNLSNLPAAVYIMIVKDEQGEILKKERLVKE